MMVILQKKFHRLKDIVFRALFLCLIVFYLAPVILPAFIIPVSWQPHHTRLPAGIHHFQ